MAFTTTITGSPGDSFSAIAINRLQLAYGDARILKGIDVDLVAGQTLALLGPSGCGKTTLLRIVAGLLEPTAGDVSINGRKVAGPGIFLPPEKRGLGMVFQDYALWPHLTVHGNVAFPLEMAGVGRSERDRRVAIALERVGLAALASRSPSALSGGQQQRVAIARAIVAEPQIVLFDEPLSNLDRELREVMVAELGALIASLGLTAIYVTHDHSEALTLADKVAIMRSGEIAQLATPDEIVEHPVSAEVSQFLRLGTIVPVTRDGDSWRLGEVSLGKLGGPQAASADMLVTPRAVRIAPPGQAPLTGKVVAVQYRDTAYATTVQLDNVAAAHALRISSTTRMRVGERIGLEIISEHLRWFTAQVPPPLTQASFTQLPVTQG